jgi:hypothetical protein
MTATSLYEKVGGVSFPFVAASVDNTKLTFEPLDPLPGVIADLIKAAINSELVAAWTKVTNSMGTAHPLYGTAPVQDTLVGHVPNQNAVQERACGFPLLAVHRSGASKWNGSQVTRTRTSTWSLHYIIGMLDEASWWKISPVVLAGVPAIVDRVLDRRRHPSYASNAVQFGEYCSTIELTEDEGGQAVFSEDGRTAFYATLMTLSTVEQSATVTGNPDEETFLGGRIDVNLYNENESATPIIDFVSGDTNPSYVPPSP